MTQPAQPAYPAPPAPSPGKPPPSWWWFLGPVVLGLAALAVGIGGVMSTLDEISTTYGDVRADGEPHAVDVPAGQEALVMVPSDVEVMEDPFTPTWRCTVTDDEGRPIEARSRAGITVSRGSRGWESLLTFTPEGGEVFLSCRVAGERLTDEPLGDVLVAKSPDVGDLAGRIAVTVLVPMLLGGIAVVWLIILAVVQVVRRTSRGGMA